MFEKIIIITMTDSLSMVAKDEKPFWLLINSSTHLALMDRSGNLHTSMAANLFSVLYMTGFFAHFFL